MIDTPDELPYGCVNMPPAEDSQAVGAFVCGRPDSQRQVVRWHDQFRDYHELAEHIDPDREAYLSGFCYPPAPYCAHFKSSGYSPRGYAGAAACRFLLFDIDRAGDLGGALADARKLLRFLLARYSPKIDSALGVYFSGAKGFHILMEFTPARQSAVNVPLMCKRLALVLAAKAGVRIDTGCYDHQRLIRLPNSRHASSGLHKRYLTHEELFTLDVPRISQLARHPAGFPMPSGETPDGLLDDWQSASLEVVTAATAADVGGFPVVPKFVRDFIGFQDIQDPGRAITLFRCAAALAEACTPAAVVFGLLEEPALKTGLEPAEVRRQISTGIEHGRKKGGVG